MPSSLRRVLAAASIAVATAAVSAPIARGADWSSAGTVHFYKATGSEFDRFTQRPTPEFQEWMRSHFWRSKVYTPYFDAKSSWYPNGWVYLDLYAIYRDSSLASQHPEWILRDGGGQRLYIPWGCGGGTCPQFAGDVGNPEFRAWWIAQARAAMAAGYKGLWVDDVNLEFRVGNGNGDQVAPIDPRTGTQMTWENWRRYVAEFVEQVRAALPGVEIVHNSIWFAGGTARDRDPYVRRQIAAADYINIERGVNDDGLTGGDGDWSLNALLAYVDRVHATGAGVVFDGYEDAPQDRAYSLASYFLVSNGHDGVGLASVTPESWWSGYDVDLGAPRGDRTTWNGVLRRDFDNGMVLVNEPGAPTRSIDLGGTFYDADGNPVTSVTLRAKDGAVLRGTPPVAPAAATTQSAPAPLPAAGAAATKTLLEALRTAPVATSAPAGAVAVQGTVQGATSGTVVVRVQRKTSHGYATVKKTIVKVSGKGRFKARVAGLRHGRYRAYAAYSGSRSARASTSRKRAFKLRKVRRAQH